MLAICAGGMLLSALFAVRVLAICTGEMLSALFAVRVLVIYAGEMLSALLAVCVLAVCALLSALLAVRVLAVCALLSALLAVCVRSPDSALQSGLDARHKFTPSGPMVWKGFISMQDFAKFFTSAYRVSGPVDNLVSRCLVLWITW